MCEQFEHVDLLAMVWDLAVPRVGEIYVDLFGFPLRISDVTFYHGEVRDIKTEVSLFSEVYSGMEWTDRIQTGALRYARKARTQRSAGNGVGPPRPPGR